MKFESNIYILTHVSKGSSNGLTGFLSFFPPFLFLVGHLFSSGTKKAKGEGKKAMNWRVHCKGKETNLSCWCSCYTNSIPKNMYMSMELSLKVAVVLNSLDDSSPFPIFPFFSIMFSYIYNNNINKKTPSPCCYLFWE